MPLKAPGGAVVEEVDGPNGVKRLPPLAQRLHVDFTGDAKWDNPRDVQVRLFPFDEQRLIETAVAHARADLEAELDERVPT